MNKREAIIELARLVRCGPALMHELIDAILADPPGLPAYGGDVDDDPVMVPREYPDTLHVPNKVTLEALREARDGNTRSYDNVDAMMADLNAPDPPTPEEVVEALRGADKADEGPNREYWALRNMITLAAAVRELAWSLTTQGLGKTQRGRRGRELARVVTKASK